MNIPFSCKRCKPFRSHCSILEKSAEKVYNFHENNVRSGALFVGGKIGILLAAKVGLFSERK